MRIGYFSVSLCFVGLLSVFPVFAESRPGTGIPLIVGEEVRLGSDILGLDSKQMANLGDGPIRCEVRKADVFQSPIFVFEMDGHTSYTVNGPRMNVRSHVVCEAQDIDTEVSFLDVLTPECHVLSSGLLFNPFFEEINEH